MNVKKQKDDCDSIGTTATTTTTATTATTVTSYNDKNKKIGSHIQEIYLKQNFLTLCVNC